MNSPDAFPELDPLVHAPARLAILTALSACHRADFMFLLRLTNTTKGNLSEHLTKLQRAGLVQTRRDIVDRRTRTLVQLTAKGARAIQEHWKRLDALQQEAQQLRSLHVIDAQTP